MSTGGDQELTLTEYPIHRNKFTDKRKGHQEKLVDYSDT
jgi:hypothetical protein